MFKLSKKSVALSTAALVVAGGVAAYAWSVNATGTGYAKTDTTHSIAFSNDTLTGLWPDMSQSIGVKYVSTNQGSVDVTLAPQVTSVKKGGVEIGGVGGACPTTAFSVSPEPQTLTLAPAAEATVPADEDFVDPELTLAAAAPNECQGVTVTVSYAAAL